MSSFSLAWMGSQVMLALIIFALRFPPTGQTLGFAECLKTILHAYHAKFGVLPVPYRLWVTSRKRISTELNEAT